MKKYFLILSIAGTILFTGCAAFNSQNTNSNSDIPISNTPTTEVSEVIDELPSDAPVTLMLWLPPQFSPDESEAGIMLNDQLNLFMEIHPTVRIEVRIKEEMGENGLLDSVYHASLAAPISLPDLIALPSQDLGEAIALNLIAPISSENSTLLLEQTFDFAIEFSTVSENFYGVPFASELLLFSYRPLANPTPPTTWKELLQSVGPVSFPGADVQSIIPLMFYQSQGGEFLNEDQSIEINQTQLLSVFELLEEGSDSHLFPFWLTQYQTDSQAWQAISENRAQASITWSRNYLLANNQSINSSAIPTKLASPFTYGKGWMWSVASKDIEKQEIIETLALFLSTPSFLAEWTDSTGYFPTNGNVLDLWSENADTALGWQLLPNAKSLPAEEILNSIGGNLQIAIEKLLKQEIDSNEALTLANSSLN
jgi:ABC-type glycerol-3-phosphate transport system substrate-binding protein